MAIGEGWSIDPLLDRQCWMRISWMRRASGMRALQSSVFLQMIWFFFFVHPWPTSCTGRVCSWMWSIWFEDLHHQVWGHGSLPEKIELLSPCWRSPSLYGFHWGVRFKVGIVVDRCGGIYILARWKHAEKEWSQSTKTGSLRGWADFCLFNYYYY